MHCGGEVFSVIKGNLIGAFFFGVVPDLFSFGIYFLINIFNKSNSEIRVNINTELQIMYIVYTI